MRTVRMSETRARVKTQIFPQGPGKKWEHYELTANGKPMRIPMHVKKGDTVQIISGDDKGKVGEIAKVQLQWRPLFCQLEQMWTPLGGLCPLDQSFSSPDVGPFTVCIATHWFRMAGLCDSITLVLVDASCAASFPSPLVECLC